MNDKIIEQYLAAYYDGTATEQEEQVLDAFFSKTDLPERWKEDQQIFLMLRDSAKITLPEGLSERLEKRLNEHIAKKNRRFTLRGNFYKIAGVAAAILLCLGITFYQNSSYSDKVNVTADTFEDPYEAAKVAEQALTFLSLNLNKGVDQMKDAEKEMQQVNEILNNQLK